MVMQTPQIADIWGGYKNKVFKTPENVLWEKPRQKLIKAGFKSDIIIYHDGDGLTKESIPFYANKIVNIYKEFGYEPDWILAFSMGGLEARYIIEILGEFEHARVIFFDTPHQGLKPGMQKLSKMDPDLETTRGLSYNGALIQELNKSFKDTYLERYYQINGITDLASKLMGADINYLPGLKKRTKCFKSKTHHKLLPGSIDWVIENVMMASV